MAREYRLRWQRLGRGARWQIFQSEKGCYDKADRLLALDEVKGDIPRFEDMPDLLGPPTIEVREVGEWEPRAPHNAPTVEALSQARQWADEMTDVGSVF